MFEILFLSIRGAMYQTIRVSDLSCEATIGVHAHEKNTTQTLIIHVDVTVDSSAAIRTDSIDDTLDYAGLATMLARLCRETRFELVESLLAHLLTEICARPHVHAARLRIDKPAALGAMGAMVSLCGERTARAGDPRG
jgi:dihydroneopterin aldolase